MGRELGGPVQALGTTPGDPRVGGRTPADPAVGATRAVGQSLQDAQQCLDGDQGVPWGPHDLSLQPVTSEGEGHCPRFCWDTQ